MQTSRNVGFFFRILLLIYSKWPGRKLSNVSAFPADAETWPLYCAQSIFYLVLVRMVMELEDWQHAHGTFIEELSNEFCNDSLLSSSYA